MVVMTTPGLDVLEIKRSPHVKHYSHIGHATSSVASYKAYGTDYFDSVLIGGEAEVSLIRELETVRSLPKKDIEVVGHPYLDELRLKMADIDEDKFFDNDLKTILVSPTWGNHGLLTLYGEELLNELLKGENYNIILRPHPQSFVSDKSIMDFLQKEFPNSEHLIWDRNIDNIKSMSQADLMISDFSGIIFDFFTLYKRPIITMNGQYEKRGRDAMDLKEDPWDLQSLDKIGRTINQEDVPNITKIIEEAMLNVESDSEVTKEVLQKMDTFPRESKERSLTYIKQQLAIINENIEIENTTDNYLLQKNHLETVTIKTLVPFLFSTQMFFQYVIASVYLFVISYICGVMLPKKGLNQIYFSKLFPRLLLLMIILSVIFISLLWFRSKEGFVYNKEKEKIKKTYFFLIFIPMIPIIQYVLSNQDILNFTESLKVILFFYFISVIFMILVPILMSPLIDSSIIVACSTGLMFITFNMASFGKTTGNNKITIILFAIIIFIYILLLLKKDRILMILSIVLFFVNTSMNIINRNNEYTIYDHSDSEMLSILMDKKVVKTPDVYLLIYDAYSNQETLKYYGYDNSEQMEYLLDKGFTIYDGTYSLGAATLTSMSQVLNPEGEIKGASKQRRVISNDNVTLKIMEDNNYTTKLIIPSKYMMEEIAPSYSDFFPKESSDIKSSKIIANAVLEGEFRFDASFSTSTYQEYLAYKSNSFKETRNTSIFMYSHDNYPTHSQNSGVLRPNETEIHLDRLEVANKEMIDNIERIKEINNEAIIIVAGDHGAYLTKNGIGLQDYDIETVDRYDVQDRFGSFLAIHWPEDDVSERYDIRIIQDIFPAVFSYMYDDESLFDEFKLPREVNESSVIGGVSIKEGIVIGGINDGEQLFDIVGKRYK